MGLHASITEKLKQAGAIDMPVTTTLPPLVNTYNTELRAAIDQRFATAPLGVDLTVTDPGSPTQYVINAVTEFQDDVDQIDLRVTNLEDTRAPKTSPVLTNPVLNVNTIANGSFTANGTITANATITANGTTGTPGQYLASDGSNNVYWATFAVAGTPSLDAVVTVSGNTSKAVAITNTFAVGNTTITGFANVSSTMAAGNTTITGFANISSSLTAVNTQLSSLGVGTAASGTSGEIRATNNITAYYSDDRLKTRLGEIENALDKIDQLTGFYYEANDIAQSFGYEKVRDVGVSAQDTQKVYGEIVAPAPIDSRYLTVRYDKFAPLLIQGIKELRVEIKNIKKHLGI